MIKQGGNFVGGRGYKYTVGFVAETVRKGRRRLIKYSILVMKYC